MSATRAGEPGAVAHATELVVRAATPADLDTVVGLRLALLYEHGGDPVYGRLHPDAAKRAPALFAQQLASPMDVFFLAELEAEPVGLLRCTESRASPLLLPERYGYVSSVYVAPAVRRQGILRVLLARADMWCRSRGITEMRLHNVPAGTAAAAAWEALGFSVVEQVRARSIGEA